MITHIDLLYNSSTEDKMSSNIKYNSGLSDAVTHWISAIHLIIAARNRYESRKVRRDFNTLMTAETEVVFLNYLALLPCLEKLGTEFLCFNGKAC